MSGTEQSKEMAQQTRPPRKERELVEAGVTGKVKWFSSRKHYGFIEREDGEGDVYVHASAIRWADANSRHELRSLGQGEMVVFDIVSSKRGNEAWTIKAANGERLLGDSNCRIKWYLLTEEEKAAIRTRTKERRAKAHAEGKFGRGRNLSRASYKASNDKDRKGDKEAKKVKKGTEEHEGEESGVDAGEDIKRHRRRPYQQRRGGRRDEKAMDVTGSGDGMMKTKAKAKAAGESEEEDEGKVTADEGTDGEKKKRRNKRNYRNRKGKRGAGAEETADTGDKDKGSEDEVEQVRVEPHVTNSGTTIPEGKVKAISSKMESLSLSST